MASENVIEIDDDNFEEETEEGIVLLDFWAPWCGPCQMQTPIVEKVADAVGGTAVIAKVNIDESPSVGQKFGIQSIPTIIIMKDGEEAQRFVGLQQEAELTAAINAL